MVGGLHTVHIAMTEVKISQLCLVQFCHHIKDSGLQIIGGHKRIRHTLTPTPTDRQSVD